MKERPILFSGTMVRAILEGRKTQTRRLVKPAPIFCSNVGWEVFTPRDGALPLDQVACPYGQPGDRLWVRETWAPNSVGSAIALILKSAPQPGVYYAATHTGRVGWRWRPSIHMPRWASRITLEVVAVRVQRLQDISRGDAMAEGCPFANMADGGDPRIWYSWLWNQINGDGSWDANPWVWVIEFKRVEGGAA